MKTIFTLFLIAFFATNALAVDALSGDSNTPLGKYRVAPVGDNLYELSYSSAGEKFIIEVLPQKEECCYIVRGENIELMYLCDKFGFGMRKVPESHQKIDVSDYRRHINVMSFSKQSLISCAKKNTTESLGLIACFFPHTVNMDSYQTVFNVKETSGDPLLSFQE